MDGSELRGQSKIDVTTAEDRRQTNMEARARAQRAGGRRARAAPGRGGRRRRPRRAPRRPRPRARARAAPRRRGVPAKAEGARRARTRRARAAAPPRRAPTPARAPPTIDPAQLAEKGGWAAMARRAVPEAKAAAPANGARPGARSRPRPSSRRPARRPRRRRGRPPPRQWGAAARRAAARGAGVGADRGRRRGRAPVGADPGARVGGLGDGAARRALPGAERRPGIGKGCAPTRRGGPTSTRRSPRRPWTASAFPRRSARCSTSAASARDRRGQRENTYQWTLRTRADVPAAVRGALAERSARSSTRGERRAARVEHARARAAACSRCCATRARPRSGECAETAEVFARSATQSRRASSRRRGA